MKALFLVFLLSACLEKQDPIQIERPGSAPATEDNPKNELPGDGFEAFSFIMKNKCNTCHFDGGNLTNFKQFQTEADWIDGGYITPGRPDQSPIFYSLKGAGILPAEEEFAPEFLPALEQYEIDAIKDWILSLE